MAGAAAREFVSGLPGPWNMFFSSATGSNICRKCQCASQEGKQEGDMGRGGRRHCAQRGDSRVGVAGQEKGQSNRKAACSGHLIKLPSPQDHG